MTKVILLNGPARSGKDTLADAVTDELSQSFPVKFAHPMQMFWGNIFYSATEDPDTYADYTNGTKKNEAHPELGFSFRSAMIDISENYIKPRYGLDFFGKVAAMEIQNFSTVLRNMGVKEPFAIVSDSGFKEEAVAIIERFGAENILHIKLYRPGFTFENDSRNYIDLTEFGVESRDIQNIQLDQFKADGIAMVREFVERN